MSGQFEVIDAFVDGERVDPTALTNALADDDGRAYFVDAWLLRDAMQDDGGVEAAVAPASRRSPARTWIVAVAASIVCLIGGYLAGMRVAHITAPGVDTASIARTPAPAPATSFPIPPATRAIPVEFSADGAARGGD